MKYIENIPEVTGKFQQGNIMLKQLQSQARTLTCIANSLRRGQGADHLTFDVIVRQAKFMHPERFETFNASLFRFTGYAVSVDPTTFFAEYEKTKEGAAYKKLMCDAAPDLYGQFTYRHLKK